MTFIKRYDFQGVSDHNGVADYDYDENASGEWCRWDDVESIVEKLNHVTASLGLEIDKSDDYREMLTEASDALKTIYANNGEDDEISKVCNALIEKFRYFVA